MKLLKDLLRAPIVDAPRYDRRRVGAFDCSSASDRQEEPLRIVLLTKYLAPYTVASGIGELYRTLAIGLSDAGHSVTVIGIGVHHEAASEHSWGRIVSLPVRPKARFIPKAFSEAFMISRALFVRRGMYDVVDCTSAPNLSALIVNPRLAVVVRAVTSIVTDSDSKLSRERTYMFILEWLGLLRATMVFISTNYILERSRKLYRLQLPNVARVSLGISDIRADSSAKAASSKLLRLLVIASASRRKGTDVLIRALARVATTTRDFEVTIVEPSWAPYKNYINEHPELLPLWQSIVGHLGDRFTVLTEISDTKKFELLTTSDYLLMTSRSESFGVPVIEAMRSGLPVISSRCGALDEVAGASASTIFYDDPEDFNALSDILDNVISTGHAGSASRRGKSREAYENSFDVKTLVANSVPAYRRAIARKRRETETVITSD